MFAKERRHAIFVNTNSEDIPGGVEISSTPTMSQIFRHRRIVWGGDPFTIINALQGREWVDKLYKYVQCLQEEQFLPSSLREKPWMTIYVDEAYNIAANGSRQTGLHILAMQGRRHGIIVVPMSQRVADVDKSIVHNCPRKIVFYVEEAERKYFETRLGVPIDDTTYAWIQQKYHRAERGPGDRAWTLHKPIGTASR